MRRTIVEWLSMLAVGLFVTTVALLAASFHPHGPAEPLGFNLERWGMGSAYLQVRGGTVSLFDQIDFESPGSPKPSIVNPRAWIWPSVTGNHQEDNSIRPDGQARRDASFHDIRRSGSSIGCARTGPAARAALEP